MTDEGVAASPIGSEAMIENTIENDSFSGSARLNELQPEDQSQDGSEETEDGADNVAPSGYAARKA